jgi:hypothetical protein
MITPLARILQMNVFILYSRHYGVVTESQRFYAQLKPHLNLKTPYAAMHAR